MDDVDVAVVVFIISTLLLGTILLCVVVLPCLCCQKRATEHCSALPFLALWIFLTLASAMLWHCIGKQWAGSQWSNLSSCVNVRLEPWTSVWQTPSTTRLIVPSNEEELLAAVLTAPRPLRAVGSGHSWSSTAHTPGTMMDIRELKNVVGLTYHGMHAGESSSTSYFPDSVGNITVQAGMKVQDAVQYLLAHGLCLYGTGSIRNQAIGGVIAHGVHGAHPDGFNRHVVGLRVLLANGTFWQVTREEDLFMWRSSIGLLGVIVEATLSVFPVPTLHFTREPIASLEYLATEIPQNIFGSATFTGYLYPSACAVGGKMIGYARVGRYVKGAADNSKDLQLNNQTDFASRLMLYFNDHMHPAMQYVWPGFGTIVSCIEQTMALSGHSLLLSGPEKDILPNDGLIPRFYEIIDYEYMVPLAACKTFAAELLGGKFGRVLIPICLRLVRAEQSCLAMAWEDSCVFGIEMMRGNANLFLDVLAIERRVGELGGAAHLGKVAVGNFRYYNYPCLPAFKEYRQRMDPNGVFLTPYLSMAFQLGGASHVDRDNSEFSPASNARVEAHNRAFRFSILFWLVLCVTCMFYVHYCHNNKSTCISNNKVCLQPSSSSSYPYYSYVNVNE